MNIDSLLSRRNSIYGICAIWVVLYHVFDRLQAPVIPIVTDVICTGNIAVDIFIFFSGLCLALSAERNHYKQSGWKEYYRKRLKRILIPYMIVAVPYYLWNAIAEHEGNVLRRTAIFFGNLSSATFWIKGTQTTWFAFGILVLYLVFPLIYRVLSDQDKSVAHALIILTLSIAFGIALSYTPVLKKSLVVWGRVPIFILGVFCGCHKDRVSTFFPHKKAMAAVSAAVFVVLMLLLSNDKLSGRHQILTIYRFLLYVPMTLSILYLASLIQTHGEVRGLAAVGRVSFEIYLVHITLLHPYKYYGIMDRCGYWSYIILPIASVGIAYAVSMTAKLCQQRIHLPSLK